MFDVASVNTLKENKLQVKHPVTGDLQPAFITLAGPEHPKHKSFSMATARELRKKFAKAGKFVPNDPAEDQENQLDKAVACTLGWEGIAREGQPLPCNEGNARELYESAPWLLEQVLEYINTTENFIVSAGANLRKSSGTKSD